MPFSQSYICHLPKPFPGLNPNVLPSMHLEVLDKAGGPLAQGSMEDDSAPALHQQQLVKALQQDQSKYVKCVK